MELSNYAKNVWDNKYQCRNGGWLNYRITDKDQLLDIIRILDIKVTYSENEHTLGCKKLENRNRIIYLSKRTSLLFVLFYGTMIEKFFIEEKSYDYTRRSNSILQII